MSRILSGPSVVASLVGLLLLSGCTATAPGAPDQVSETSTLAVAEAFLQAAGSGDGETLNRLMHDDFVWHNEGDSRLPWIGDWKGKSTVFGTFMPAFGAGLSTTLWTTDFRFVSGDQAVFMGQMAATANATGESTGEMSWAVRVHVVDGQVKSWNWFEDSYAVSRAYHGGGE